MVGSTENLERIVMVIPGNEAEVMKFELVKSRGYKTLFRQALRAIMEKEGYLKLNRVDMCRFKNVLEMLHIVDLYIFDRLDWDAYNELYDVVIREGVFTSDAEVYRAFRMLDVLMVMLDHHDHKLCNLYHTEEEHGGNRQRSRSL